MKAGILLESLPKTPVPSARHQSAGAPRGSHPWQRSGGAPREYCRVPPS